MPTAIDQLRQFSGSAALAIHNSVIIGAIEAAFTALKATSGKYAIPIPTAGAKTQIAANLRLVGALPTVAARGAAEPLFDLSSFKAAVTLHAKRDPAERLIEFECEVPASVVRLNLDSMQKLIVDFEEPDNPPMVGTAATDHLADPGDRMRYFNDENEYHRMAYGTEITIRSTLASLILSGVALPAFADSCEFTFVAPSLKRTEDYTVIASDRIDGPLSAAGDPNCPRGHDAKHAVRASPKDGAGFQAVVEHDRGKEPVNAPRSWSDMPRFALSLPKSAFEGLLLGAFKPAVRAAQKGQFLLIYWEYVAVAILDGAAVIPIIDAANIEVSATGLIKIDGSAGAGITLGCVRHQVLGARLESDVLVDVRIGFEWDEALGEIRLYSRFNRPKVDLTFHFSGLPFPLDQVVSLIVAEILKSVVYRKVVQLLNALRVSVMDLSKLWTGRGRVNVVRHAAHPEALIVAPDWEG